MGSDSGMMQIFLFASLFCVLYFLILRPQNQKMKKHQQLLANLRRGDRVVTNGGLIGTISKIVSDTEVQLELADDVRVRQIKGMIADVLAKTDPVEASRAGAASNTASLSPIVKKSTQSKITRKTPANRKSGK
jgi:preprotein translocase subunit YajC